MHSSLEAQMNAHYDHSLDTCEWERQQNTNWRSTTVSFMNGWSGRERGYARNGSSSFHFREVFFYAEMLMRQGAHGGRTLRNGASRFAACAAPVSSTLPPPTKALWDNGGALHMCFTRYATAVAQLRTHPPPLFCFPFVTQGRPGASHREFFDNLAVDMGIKQVVITLSL